MGDRTSIKTSREVFDQLNEDRKERGLTWDDYLLALYDDPPAAGDVQVTLDDRELVREVLSEMADGESLMDITVDTDQLAKDIAAYASGGDLDEDALADRVAEQVSADVRDTMRQMVAR